MDKIDYSCGSKTYKRGARAHSIDKMPKKVRSMVKYNGINHLSMATGDMDKTVRFWRDLLGLRLVVGLGRPGYRNYFFALTDKDMISFFEWPKVEPIEEKDHGYPVAGPFAFDHVALGVESRDDLWVLKDKLEAAGFWASEVVDHGFILSVYSFDPNGIAIEFSYNVNDVDVRKNPRMIDSAPTETTLEGPDPVPGKWPTVREATPETDRIEYPGEGEDLISGNRKNWFGKE